MPISGVQDEYGTMFVLKTEKTCHREHREKEENIESVSEFIRNS